MKGIFFWRNWDRSNRVIFNLYLLLILISIGYLLYGYFFGLKNAIGWEILGSVEKIELPLPEFDVGNFRVSPKIDSYALLQYLQGSILKIYPVNSYIFLVFLVLGFNLILSLLPSMKKLWFYIGMGGFIVFGISLRLENLYLFGTPDKTGLIILLSVYLSIAYIFHEIKRKATLFFRYMIFTSVTLIFGIIIWLFSEVENPFIYVTNFGITIPIVISILFIIVIAHEIIFGILYVITHHNTKKSAHSLEHFLILSSLYLAYITLSYFWYIKIIKIDFWFVNPFLLFIVSTIIGLYGFKRRDFIYGAIMPFKPIGGLMYLAFALISLGTISYAFNSANDPLVETFEDVIFYAHIGYGTLFFVYIIANFFATLILNYQVSKIAYKPEYIPFYTFRLMGLIAVIALFLRANMIVLSQSRSAYYNGIADIHYLHNELRIAEEYYNVAGSYVYQNHRSNYALATLSRIQRNKTAEAFYLENAILKNPSEHAIIGLSNLYLRNKQFLQGLFNLEEGLHHFPNSSAIKNNTGYFYSKTDIIDSSYYFFDQSYRNRGWDDLAGANIFGLLAKEAIPVNPDSISSEYTKAKDYAVQGNLLALKNQRGINTDSHEIIELNSPSLSTSQFVYYYNLGYEQMNRRDTSYLTSLNSAIRKSRSTLRENRLMFLKSAFLYYNGRVTEAFRAMSNLADRAITVQDYYRMLGLWSLQSGSPKLSIEYFEKAGFGNNPEYDFYGLIAYLENGAIIKADSLLGKLDVMGAGELQNEISNINRIIHITDLNSIVFSDLDKYQIVRYRSDLFKSEEEIREFINTIDNNVIRSLLKTELAEKYFKYGDLNKTVQYLGSSDINDSEVPELIRRSSILKLKILKNRKDFQNLASGFEEFKKKFGDDDGHLDLFQAALYNVNGDSVKAKNLYTHLAKSDPFNEEAIIDAAEYFYKNSNDSYYAYKLFLEALEINPYSVPLLRAFANHCLEIRLTDYAQDALRDLEHLWPEEYNKLFVEEIENKMNEIESERSVWSNEPMLNR